MCGQLAGLRPLCNRTKSSTSHGLETDHTLQFDQRL